MNTIVDLLRHGEPIGGRAYRGSGVDDPLSGTGWAQMRSAVGQYADWDRIVTSPLQRCRAFAEELAQGLAVPVKIEPDLREVGFGVWEGRTPEEIVAEDQEGYEAFCRDPEHCRPAGAEPLDEFARRVHRAYEDTIREYSGMRLLIVSHAGVMRAIIASVVGAPAVAMYRIRIDNAGISRIRHGQLGPRLEFHNVRTLSQVIPN